MDTWSTILLFALCLVCSAYFAGAETAFASVNRIRMISIADDGDRRAKRVLYILDRFDKALTTLLIGNNVMHIGAATLSTLLATKIFGDGAVTLTTLVTTLIIFLFAEMIPKCFAKSCNEKYALQISGSIVFLMKIMTPVSIIFIKLSDIVGKPFHKMGGNEPTVTEDELEEIIDSIPDNGTIDGDTADLMQNAMDFVDTDAKDIITPWFKVVKIGFDMSCEEVLAVIRENTFSRLPVVDANDRPIGLLNIRKYIKRYMQIGDRIRLKDVMGKISFVSKDAAANDLLAQMSAKKTHMAIVKDKNGKILGILTVEDLLEELVGEIYDEEDGGVAHE